MESNDNIHLLFPTCLYTADNVLDQSENEKLFYRVMELSSKVESGGKNWSCNTINSLGTFDLRSDPTFSKLNSIVYNKVKEFAGFFNSKYDYTISESWYNISTEGSFQEGHVHPRNVFSCVYYCAVPPESGDLMLYSNENEMMPLYNITSHNQYNSLTQKYAPKERSLIIFRSSVRHMVEVGSNKEPRVSLSFNLS